MKKTEEIPKVDIPTSEDDFYNPYNQKVLRERIQRINDGTAKFVVKTIEELEAMEEE